MSRNGAQALQLPATTLTATRHSCASLLPFLHAPWPIGALATPCHKLGMALVRPLLFVVALLVAVGGATALNVNGGKQCKVWTLILFGAPF
jgi:hypothetical protein